MESSCSVSACPQKPAFLCKCKTPPVLICDSHFSAHIKQKGLSHQYEFISIPTSQPPPSIPQLTTPIKHEEIKKLISNLPEAARKTLLPQRSSPKPPSLMSSVPHLQVKLESERISYSAEEFYEGELDSGREHGHGKFVGKWKNLESGVEGSVVYNGEWRYGAPHGKGELVFRELKLEGTWFQGSLTGDGSLEMVNGDRYVGEFFECKFNGNGRYWFGEEEEEVVGYFKDHSFASPRFFTCVNLEFLRKIEGLKDKDLKVPDRFKIICEVFTAPLSKYTEPVTTVQNCFFFKNNSLQLLKIHTETLEKSEHSIETSQRFPSLGGLCEIDNCLFQAGGLLGEKSAGLTFILNPETWELRWLEPCYKRSTPCSLPLTNKVYLFGGADLFLNFIKENEVFDFATQKWSALPDLPLPSDGMSGGVVGKFFVISGYMHTKVYIFDWGVQRFSEVFDLPDFKEKVFCVAHGVCFLMCGKKMYEAKIGNPFEWRFVREVSFNSGWPVGMPVRRGECFYWYTTDKEVWKFDKETKGVFLLKKFK